METPAKYEQFRVIICAFRKYTTLPRARLQSPRKKDTSCGVFRLVLFPQESPYIFYTFVINIRLVSLFLLCPSLFHIYKFFCRCTWLTKVLLPNMIINHTIV